MQKSLLLKFQHTAARRRLLYCNLITLICWQFQHTAARRRLPPFSRLSILRLGVSTHSRAEAAALFAYQVGKDIKVSTHSRAEAAACKLIFGFGLIKVSTHSRAEAAARPVALISLSARLFQHTAARRRLL